MNTSAKRRLGEISTSWGIPWVDWTADISSRILSQLHILQLLSPLLLLHTAVARLWIGVRQVLILLTIIFTNGYTMQENLGLGKLQHEAHEAASQKSSSEATERKVEKELPKPSLPLSLA